jgi:serine protease Do/serine protease DegQ
VFVAGAAAIFLVAAPARTWAAPPPPDAAALPARDGIPSLAPLVERAAPAVVNISVKSKAELPDMSAVPREFRRFFQMPYDDDDNNDTPPQRTQTSIGSGVIIDAKKGYIITNHHVIENATEVVITLKDRREFPAKIIGSDEGTDVALLQIDAKDLTALPVGDSTALKVGDFVIAVGNPLGLGQTVTYGIVSALSRPLQMEGYTDFIQTDAPINRGNSGGALINMRGELVGMPSIIMSPAGGNIGIGFAVPTAMIQAVVAQLIEYGTVKRGLIGVEISDLNPTMAKNLGIDATEGALIGRVVKGSPAESAGIKAGDVVTALNGKQLHSSADLRNRLGLLPVGTTVELAVNRDGKKMNIKVTIGKSPKAEVAKAAEREELQGATFESADSDKGVRVTDVSRGSNAWQIGLRPRDLIVAVNRKTVSNFNDFMDALKDSRHSTVVALKRGEEDVRIVLP